MRTMQHVAGAARVAAGRSLAGSGGSSKTAKPGNDPDPPAGPSGRALSTEAAAVLAAVRAAEAAAKKSRAGIGSRAEDLWFDAISVHGQSSTAVAKAQAILDAAAAVAAALKTAEDQKTKAQMAQTRANQLPADTPDLAELKAQLAAAIAEADRVIAAIKAIQTATGVGTLRHAVGTVKGADGMGTAAQIGMPAAQQIDAALARRGAAGENRPVGNAVRMTHEQKGYLTASPVVTLGGLAGDHTVTEVLRLEDDAPEGSVSFREVVGDKLRTGPKDPRYSIPADGLPAGTTDGVEDCAACGSLDRNRQGSPGTPLAGQYLWQTAGGMAATYKGRMRVLLCEGTLHGSGRSKAPTARPRTRMKRSARCGATAAFATQRPNDEYVWSEARQIYEPIAYAKYGYWLSSSREHTRSRSTSNEVRVHTFAYIVRPNPIAYYHQDATPAPVTGASTTRARTGT